MTLNKWWLILFYFFKVDDERGEGELANNTTERDDQLSVVAPPVPPRAEQRVRRTLSRFNGEGLGTPLLDPEEKAVERTPPAIDLLRWEKPREALIIECVIGEGAFGQVAKGTLKNREGNVAVKMLKGACSKL